MRRRKLLFGAGLLFSALGFGGVAAYISEGERSAVVAILRRRLGGMRTFESDLQRFAADYIQQREDLRHRLRVLGVFSIPLQWMTLYPFLQMESPLRRIENNIVSNFLISTDFFENGAKLDVPVRYLGFYDPYRTPCRRPIPPRE